MSFGLWIRDKLMEAGDKGMTVADLHKLRVELGKFQIDNKVEYGFVEDIARYKGGTYNSFARYFHWFKQLGFVEEVRTEPSTTKGSDTKPEKEYRDRHYYRISTKGKRAPIDEWYDPIEAVTGLSAYQRIKKYRLPTGRPRGRPPKSSLPPWEE